MTDPQLPPGVCRTGEVRLMFPSLDEPRAVQEGQKKKFGCALFFPPGTDLAPFKAILKAAVEKKWGTDPSKWPDDMRQPLKQAERVIDAKTGKMYEGLMVGGWLINISSERPPGLVRADNSRIANAKVELYAGCYVRATINAYSYGGPGTRFRPGVSFGMRSIQKLRDGDPLGGVMVDPEKEFAPMEAPAGAASAVTGEAPKVVSAADLFR